MNEATRNAFIYIREVFAGILSETDEGYSFAYDNEYLENPLNPPVSLTLPLRQEPYSSNVLFSFFDGLIPEGWLLDEVINNWKIDRKDRFGILLVSAIDPIGAISVRSEKS